jgi:glutamate racemase
VGDKTRGMADRDGAIGIFDSGVGGLTVLHALLEALPREDLVYLGDTARYPYGARSVETVTRYSLENVDFLAERGIKMLVVACNTASALALEALQARYAFPIVGVIEPGARGAVERTRNARIGVIGTEATIASGAYTTALRALRPGLELYTRACPLFVPLAEEGWLEGPIPRGVVETYLASMQKSGIDTLVLGCTHYPLLKPVIAAVMGEGVALVDSAEETARVAAEALASRGLARANGAGSASFFVTDVPDRFVRIGKRFLGSRLESAVRIER